MVAIIASGCRKASAAVVRQARMYVRRCGQELAVSEAGTLDLCRVQHWLEDPVRRKIPPGAVLEAVQNSAYEKLFEGECATWTPDEQCAVLELVGAGV
jgi:hypothetical protein